MSAKCKGYGTSRSSREQEPYHWYGQYLHQCEICQIWMSASRSFYVPWSCTREGQGCTIVSLSKEIDIKDISRKITVDPQGWNSKRQSLNTRYCGIVSLCTNYDSMYKTHLYLPVWMGDIFVSKHLDHVQDEGIKSLRHYLQSKTLWSQHQWGNHIQTGRYKCFLYMLS